MAILNKTALAAKLLTKIYTNGVNEITAEMVQEIIQDIIDSAVNSIDDVSTIEAAAVATALSDIRDGVDTAGDTLAKLYALIPPVIPDFCTVKNDVVSNINNSPTGTQFEGFKTTFSKNSNAAVYKAIDVDGITVAAGLYEVHINMYQTSTTDRTDVGIEVTLNGNPEGTRGSTGYIRTLGGHNESSSHLAAIEVLAAEDDIIGFMCFQEASTGTVVAPADRSHIFIRRIQ